MVKKEEKKIEPKLKVETKVDIVPINIKQTVFKIEGKSPLLMDKMPEEVLQAIQDKQTGKGKTGKTTRDIKAETFRAVHILPDGSVGFPSLGFTAGMIESTSFVGDSKFSKKLIRGLRVLNSVNGLIPIKFKTQDVNKHNVGSNTKYSPQFNDWSCELELQFDANNLSIQDIATLINYAGFYYGIGMWSPRCKSGGNYGMYALAKK